MAIQAYAIRLTSSHDSNGNPRRIIVVHDLELGIVVDTEDQGYKGQPAAVETLRKRLAPEVVFQLNGAIPSVEVPTRIYRKYLKKSLA